MENYSHQCTSDCLEHCSSYDKKPKILSEKELQDLIKEIYGE